LHGRIETHCFAAHPLHWRHVYKLVDQAALFQYDVMTHQSVKLEATNRELLEECSYCISLAADLEGNVCLFASECIFVHNCFLFFLLIFFFLFLLSD
jgi:hypothetical protein